MVRTVELLGKSLRPGGLMLTGEPYRRQEVPDQETAEAYLTTDPVRYTRYHVGIAELARSVQLRPRRHTREPAERRRLLSTQKLQRHSPASHTAR